MKIQFSLIIEKTNQRNNKITFGSRADRLLQTVALYKSGVIKKILVTSGSADLLDTKIKEADLVKVYLREIGIPDSVILIENQSRNTLENAKFSKAMEFASSQNCFQKIL